VQNGLSSLVRQDFVQSYSANHVIGVKYSKSTELLKVKYDAILRFCRELLFSDIYDKLSSVGIAKEVFLESLQSYIEDDR
jgi:hypothetical protein